MTIIPKKNLTADEITELRNCPFVASVISGRVKFTPEFKRMAYQQLTSGKSVREIFEENGINPDILGDARLWGFAQKLLPMLTVRKALLTCEVATTVRKQKAPKNRL